MSKPSSAPSRWACTAEHVDLDASAASRRAASDAAQPQHVTLDLAAAAIVVVDMQNDFCHEQGWLAGKEVDVSGGAALLPGSIRCSRGCGKQASPSFG